MIEVTLCTHALKFVRLHYDLDIKYTLNSDSCVECDVFESLLRLFGIEPVKCLCKHGWKCRVVIKTWACGYISEPLGNCLYKDYISAWLGILFLSYTKCFGTKRVMKWFVLTVHVGV